VSTERFPRILDPIAALDRNGDILSRYLAAVLEGSADSKEVVTSLVRSFVTLQD